MKRICVWGTSLKKVADEAQVIAFVRIVKSRYPDTKITLFSQFGELMTELMAKEGFEIETIRTVHLGKVIRAISHSDLFVLEGGPFFEDPLQTLRFLTLFSIAKFFGCPIITYAASAFYYRTSWGRLLYRFMFDRMDSITVREKIAVDILKDLGVKKKVALFADPRFVLDTPSEPEVRNILSKEGIDCDKPLIAITTRYLHKELPKWVKRSHSYTDEAVENANEVIARAIAYLSELAQLILIPMHPGYYEDIVTFRIFERHIEEKLRLRILSRRYNSLDIIGIIDYCDLIFSSRVGSSVFATVTGTPIIAVAYEPRMIDHMERIGYGQYVFDWRDLKYEDLVKEVDDVWMSRYEVRKLMESRVKDFKKMAWENAEVLDSYLK